MKAGKIINHKIRIMTQFQPFTMELHMSMQEKAADYNLSEIVVHPLLWEELQAFDPIPGKYANHKHFYYVREISNPGRS
jgi:hypothetical protein